MSVKDDPEKLQKDLLDLIKKMSPEEKKSQSPKAENSEDAKEEKEKKRRKDSLRFNLKPRDIKEYLDKYVIKQDDAKRVLATAVCDHYNHIKSYEAGDRSYTYTKQNVIMLGPTGVGKTYLIKSLADLIGVPFVKADATKYSETGYVGGDVTDLVRDLVDRAKGDISLAEYGMVYLDEVDKIATPSNQIARDVSGSGVQRGLLKIMEETEIPLRNPQDVQSQVQAMMEFQQKGKVTKPMINTKHILFIVSGAFDGLDKIIKKRIRKQEIGFNTAAKSDLLTTEIIEKVRTEDFVSYGFEPEFIGRLPVRVQCSPLNSEDLYQILKYSEGSLIKQIEASFRAYGIKMIFEDDALREIAKLAESEGTGARGLSTVCEKILRELKYELPSTKVKEFTLTGQMVASNKKAIKKLLDKEKQEELKEASAIAKEYEKNFLAKNDIKIKFDETAIKALYKKIHKSKTSPSEILNEIMTNYDYGLELIHKKNPQKFFLITEENINNPKAVLDYWIKTSYENEGGKK